MPKKSRKESNSTVVVKDFITVAFAEDMDLAKQYKQMLTDHEIPVAIRRQPEMAQNGFSDIAILVPESLLDEAHTLISEQSSYDDFFDMAFRDDTLPQESGGYEDSYEEEDVF
ncbi:MAG: hypothetical protein H8E62_05910 [Planctomycetes bacterium]|nr:hypothetical protein [Planctomycetota bacterium]